MTIQIGRAGRDSALTLRSPRSWSVNGPEVDLDGALTADTYAGLVLLRAQVAGLADNPDEPIVPVNWTGDASVDGYYEVLDAAVPMPPRGLAALRLEYRVRLRRVAVYPDINSLLIGNAVRTNSHSIAKGTTVPWWATPADATMDLISGATATTRTADTGTLRIQYTTDGTVLYNRTARWQAAASDYYDGACRVELFDGTNYLAAVGRRLPNTHPQYGWRMTNGLVRVSIAGDGLITVEHYVSGSWSVSKTYKLTAGTGPTTLGGFKTVTVLRNSAEVVTVRLGLEQATGTEYQMSLDLTLRRGALWVEGVVARDPGPGTVELGIYRNTAEAAATFTGGVRADAPDAAGYYWLATSKTKTNDLTQGGFRASTIAGSTFDFAAGFSPTGASTPDTVTSQVYSYFGPIDESVGFASR